MQLNFYSNLSSHHRTDTKSWPNRGTPNLPFPTFPLITTKVLSEYLISCLFFVLFFCKVYNQAEILMPPTRLVVLQPHICDKALAWAPVLDS